MGVPLSFFSAFWAVQATDRPGHRKAVEVFGRYSLLAFVLSDPRSDPELHRRLRDEWSVLDDLTGEDLLFFAPVDPPEAWSMKPDVARRGWMRLARVSLSAASDRVSRERRYMPLVSRDPSETTLTFRQLLGVPPGMRSCLVIARSVHDERAWLLATSAERIGAQLERLALLAHRASRQSMSDETLGTSVARIARDSKAVADALALTAPLAAILTDACAIPASSSERSDQLTAERAKVQILQSGSAAVMLASSLPEDAAIARLAQAGALLAALPAPTSDSLESSVVPDFAPRPTLHRFRACHSPRPELDFAERPPRLACHPRTKELLQMGDKCLALITDGAFDDIGARDFRMAVALWAQALEHEMAELLGHEVRAGLGVTLPEYHWRKQPGLQGIAIECAAHGGPIPFNQARPDSPDPDRALWQPPAMGSLRLGWEAWRARVDAPVPRPLIDLLLQCKEHRNAAAHPGAPIGQATALDAQNAVHRAIEMIVGMGIKSWASRA
jgi:hypothetical protein